MKYKLITNNPTVHREYSQKLTVEYEDSPYVDVLIKARDYIHKGLQLYSHPLSGNIRSNEMPYKSILISGAPGEMDHNSILLIEESINFCKNRPPAPENMPQDILEDFQFIDYTLISTSIK